MNMKIGGKMLLLLTSAALELGVRYITENQRSKNNIKENENKATQKEKYYQVRCEANTKFEAAKTRFQSQLKNIECSCDILRNFGKERAAADRYHANAMTDVEKARMMFELKREFKDIIREERMTAEGQQPDESVVEEELDEVWEDFNDAVYNHTNESFTWLLGNVIKAGSINGLIGQKGIGKTLCLMTIMNCIAKGIPFDLFVSDPSKPYSLPPQKVFLYDLEMLYEDLSERNGKHGYEFTNIKRIGRMYNVKGWLRSVRKKAESLTEDATFVLDNVTRLNDDVTQPSVGKRLFDGVKEIRDEAKAKGVKLTFIMVAHTTNDLDEWKPLTLKDVAVSDSFTTGLDSISFIGKTRYENIVMFKVNNQRHSRTSDQVALLKRVEKPFLGCEIEGYYKEADVRPHKDGKTTLYTAKKERIDNLADVEEPKIKGWPLSKILELQKEYEACKSLRKLEKEYGLSAQELGRKLNALKKYLASKETDEEGEAE